MKQIPRPILNAYRLQVRSAYSAAVNQRFSNPKYTGTLDKTDNQVGTSIVGSPACGDMLKMQIKFEEDKIIDVRYNMN